ncbi:acyl-CoA desaturase [Myxosarcina sp. GI1(2024)]
MMNITIKSRYLQNTYKRLSFFIVIIPTLGFIVGLGLLWQTGISTWEIALLVCMYGLTALGLELGFHRYFSHRAFETTNLIRIALAILGSMAVGGGVIYWVAHHRRHHQYADQLGDLHSPHLWGNGIKEQVRGLWHAHVGWILQGEVTNSMLFAKDLLRDPMMTKINRLQPIWVVLGLVIPAVMGGTITGTWMGVFRGFIWGGLVRIFLVHQFIWSTNSICHFYGSRPFDTGDRSTNNIWLAIPTFGQSWHNNHHAFPNSAIVGLEWWQIDLSTWVIRVLEAVGLVWKVKAPKAGAIEAKKIE